MKPNFKTINFKTAQPSGKPETSGTIWQTPEQIPVKPVYTEIPQGRTRDEIQQREKIIKDFYAMWNAANPTKHIQYCITAIEKTTINPPHPGNSL
jgi:hypothetical protein